MDRYWFLTNTCYGNRLPGDARGFVGRVWDFRPGDVRDAHRVTHHTPGTPCDEDLGGLERASRELMKGPPILLTPHQAGVAVCQFRETARVRGWHLSAVAMMTNHFHLIVGVTGDPPPSKILGDFKSWSTRKLSATFGEPPSKTWWTERGSKRRLADGDAIGRVRHYVLHEQPAPLVVWASVEA